jgi:hypothetical protein
MLKEPMFPFQLVRNKWLVIRVNRFDLKLHCKQHQLGGCMSSRMLMSKRLMKVVFILNLQS